MSEKLRVVVEQFGRAVNQLQKALEKPKDEFMRDSAIQRFEFTYELAWKALKLYLGEKAPSLQIRFPGECFREAYKIGLIENDPLWIKTIEERNKTSHTYNEDTAEDVYKDLPDFLRLYEGLLTQLKEACHKDE